MRSKPTWKYRCQKIEGYQKQKKRTNRKTDTDMDNRQKLEIVKFIERNRKRRSEEIELMRQIHGQKQRILMAVMEMMTEEEQTEMDEME